MPPITVLPAGGVTAIETKLLFAITVRVAVPETEPTVAVMVDEPAETPVARPLASMVAILVAEEDQVAFVRVAV